MCGLFGFVRAPGCDPRRATKAFIALGRMAEERGRHAAGLAACRGDQPLRTSPTGGARSDTTVSGWRVVKALGAFAVLWKDGLAPYLDGAPVVIGHTRFATQGAVVVNNASPLRVGSLIGTHNGDIDPAVLQRRYSVAADEGATDTETLLMALSRTGADVERIADVLQNLVGRAALAWADISQPGRLWLARTAISPLAVGRDEDGTLYWASNPAWFGHPEVRIAPSQVRLLPEGRLLEVAYSPGEEPRIARVRRFSATARPVDDALVDSVAHLGFNAVLRNADRGLLTHRTLGRAHRPLLPVLS